MGRPRVRLDLLYHLMLDVIGRLEYLQCRVSVYRFSNLRASLTVPRITSQRRGMPHLLVQSYLSRDLSHITYWIGC